MDWGPTPRKNHSKHQYGDKRSQKGLDNFTPWLSSLTKHTHMRRKNLKYNHTQKPPASAPPTISIQIHMPRVRRPKGLDTVAEAATLADLSPGSSGWCYVEASGHKRSLYMTYAASRVRRKKCLLLSLQSLGINHSCPQQQQITKRVPEPSYNEQRQLYTFNDIYQGTHITVYYRPPRKTLKITKRKWINLPKHRCNL